MKVGDEIQAIHQSGGRVQRRGAGGLACKGAGPVWARGDDGVVYGKGRVFLSGPHPEAQEETYPLLLAAVEWCAGLSDAAQDPPPRAVAQIPAEGIAGRFVPCSAAGSRDPQGYPVGYTWDFGDGSPRQHRPEAIHIYEQPGNYTITLTVSTGTRHSAVAKTVSMCTPQQA